MEKRTIIQGGFSHLTYMSKFASKEAVIDWLEEHGCLVTLGIERQVDQLWSAAEYRADHPDQFTAHFIDYEIVVSAKKNSTKARVYFSKRIRPVL